MYFNNHNHMNGKIIIFSAPSGSGKSTIIKEILQLNPNFQFSVSATSRSPRNGETDGTDYHFLSVDSFQAHINNNDFLEYEEVYQGVFYGTLKNEVELMRSKGQHVVFDVDVVGGCHIKKYFGNQALSIFIAPPSVDVLRKRLLLRNTDTPEGIDKRIQKATFELDYAKNFDVVVVNDVLEIALKQTINAIKKFLND